MRQLLLMRHAKAAREPGLSDHARSLTQRGRDDTVRVARFLQDNKLSPDLAIASDARRTRETLELATGQFTPAPTTRLDANLYLAEPYAILKAIRATPATVSKLLIVGHNPGVHELALALAGRGQQADVERLALSFATAAVAIINLDSEWSAVGELAGRLERLVIAKVLREEQNL